MLRQVGYATFFNLGITMTRNALYDCFLGADSSFLIGAYIKERVNGLKFQSNFIYNDHDDECWDLTSRFGSVSVQLPQEILT